MRLFLQLVMEASCSLRSASGVLELLRGLLPDLMRRPAPNTGQAWLLRLGLYELRRPKEAADDWVWILDHTVQIGVTKCLLIVGCRLSHWREQGRPLEHHDLQVLALEPVEKSNGEIVYQQLERTCERTGITPRALVGDEGTDLKGGMQAFRAAHPETAVNFDIAHQAAKLLKRELEADARWATFVGQAGGAKQRLAQTPWAHLLPPTPRTKARYMNLDELVGWGRKTLRYLDDPYPVAGEPLDRGQLQEKLGWLADYRAALDDWSGALQTISQTLHSVRSEGYHAGAGAALGAKLASGPATEMGGRLAARLVAFVAAESQAARPGERLLGSSECLESLIGKGKRLEGQQSRSGFTKMLLGLAAAVVQPSPDYLRRALTSVTTHDVLNWVKEHLGVSVQSKRRQALAGGGTKTG